nr:hypothetical protein [Tanacetum cinerariifolium]
MAAFVIPISSDSSEDSVGSHVLRVILFGTISPSIPVILVVPAEVPVVPADPLVAPEVGAVSAISPTGVLDLVDYSSSSDYDPSKDSLPLVPELPWILPFLCSYDSETDSELPAEQRPERHESHAIHDVMVSRIHRQPTILIRPGKAIHFGWPYHTHPNGLYTSLGSPLDLLSDSSSVHSSRCNSLECDSSGQAHSGPSTRVVSSRLAYPPVLTPGDSEDFRHRRSTPLSTLYLPTTSESTLDSSSERSLDSFSPSFGPSHKRCISPTTLSPSSTPVSRSIATTPADLIPPRKRFRGLYSPKVNKKGHMEIGTADAKAVADLGIDEGVGAPTEDGIGMGVEIDASDFREDEEEFKAEASAVGTMEIDVDPLVTGDNSEFTRGGILDLEDTVYDIVHYMTGVLLDRITKTMTNTHSRTTPVAIKEMINQRVAIALEAHKANKNPGLGNGNVDGNGNERNGNGNHNGGDEGARPVSQETMTNTHSRTNPVAIEEMINQRVATALEAHKANKNPGLGNGNVDGNGNEGNGNGNHNGGDEGARPVSQEFTYQDFMKYSALTWWNSHKRTIGTDAVFAISWRELMKLMAKRFQELTMLCTKMVPKVEDQVERFIGGLPNNIQGNVIAAEPTRLQDAVRMANNLMDQKLKGYATKNPENKRRLEVNQRDNRWQ